MSNKLKLNPLNIDTWIGLGHVLWKKKDLEAALQCFKEAQENCGDDKRLLRFYSMVLRAMNNETTKKSNVQESVKIAKDAIQLDYKDGESWC